MDILLKLLLIPLIGGLDFLRGNTWPIGWGGAKKGLLGLALAYASGLTGWGLAIGTILWGASYANGWGTPLGASLALGSGEDYKKMGPGFEGWQTLLGKIMPEVMTDPYLAMQMRGVLAFLYISPLVYFNWYYLIMLPVLIYAYSGPTKLSAKVDFRDLKQWKKYEIIRGLIIGAGAVIVGITTII